MRRCWLAFLIPCASLVSAAEPPIIVTHPLPTPGARPYIVIIGPDRQVWFSESGAHRIGRLDTRTARVREFVVPTPNSQPIGLTAGRDGWLWFAETAANRIGRLSTGGQFREFDCPRPHCAPEGVYADEHGTVWFAEGQADRLASIAFDGAIREYSGMSAGGHPLSVTGRDGVIWVSEPDGNRLAYLKDGLIGELALPPNTQPRAMLTHPDGSLWFVATGTHALGRVDRSEHVEFFTLPDPAASPRSLAVAPDGRIWFTEDIVNRIGVMSASGELLGEYPVAPMRGLRGIAVADDGRVYFAAYDTGAIGELDPSQLSSSRAATRN